MIAPTNGDTLDADVCDEMIARFRQRLDAMQREATEVRQQFEELHARWLAHVEARNGGGP